MLQSDWLKFVTAVLALENSSIHCSLNTSLLSSRLLNWLLSLCILLSFRKVFPLRAFVQRSADQRISCYEKLLSCIPRRRRTVSFNIHQFIWALLRNKHWVCVLVQLTFLQHVWRSTTHWRMAQCRERILKMEEWSTNFTVMRGSVSMALLSFIVTKDSGMALHQVVSQMVSISERNLSITNHLFKSTTTPP